ncbi:hypothetical protein [Flavobacterium cerinum]|uniref:Uncharacterized protein n=1 Tax=Flavobacterium cerinum TaxID=2502784 RepID=A0A3S3QZZ9_9FLAO|nr:hypothetical protein [Flavobacterium cerinum]RWX00063.1 hypothetical protein EPI11_11000 [Flavobacterium cerinum]
MANQTNSTENEEINLSHLSKKAKGYFSRVNDSFFDGILFIKRNIIIVALLVIAGAALGVIKDKGDHRYKTKVFLIPNFESVDYLYKQIEKINTKFRQGDKAFVAKNKINKSSKVLSLKIEPVVDIYSLVDNPNKTDDENDRTFYLFKLISESGDLKSVLEADYTSKNYKKHLLTITTNDMASYEKDIKPIIEYLNSDPYYKLMMVEYINNLNLKMAANEKMIAQMDALLDDFSMISNKLELLNFNDKTELNEVLKLKDKLVRQQAALRIEKVNYTKIIKDTSMMLNMKDYNITTGTKKFIYPILLLLLFVALVKFKNYYKSQSKKRKMAAISE